jgi:nucleotide-binding universal stress UspA family protein
VPPPLDDPPASPPPLPGPFATSPPAQDPPASPAPASPAPAEPPVAALPLVAYPLPRCAAIAASIDRRPAERDDILKAHDLAPDTWTDLERHWAAALLAEAERGRAKLSRAYDSAYVAQLEAERGFIDVSAYAKIVVAAERSDEARALADLDLPRAAILPIRRVWLRKIADDAALAASARKEIQAAQDEEDDQ